MHSDALPPAIDTYSFLRPQQVFPLHGNYDRRSGARRSRVTARVYQVTNHFAISLAGLKLKPVKGLEIHEFIVPVKREREPRSGWRVNKRTLMSSNIMRELPGLENLRFSTNYEALSPSNRFVRKLD